MDTQIARGLTQTRLGILLAITVATLGGIPPARAGTWDATAFAFSAQFFKEPPPVPASQIRSYSIGSGSTDLSVDLSGAGAGQGIVSGAAVGMYAPPIFATGVPDPGAYLSTGIGRIVLNFNAPESYFGILWGSVDAYNTSGLMG